MTTIPRQRFRLGIVFLLVLLLLSLRLPQGASLAQDTTEVVELNLHITDEVGSAIADAEATVLKWTGDYERIDVSAKTDQDGKAKLTYPFTDSSYYLLLQAEGYASSVRDLLHITEPKQENIDFKLSPPVEPRIKVTANGNPVSNAEISTLEFTDINSNKVYLTHKHSKQLGYITHASDEKGVLTLPAIPKGSDVTLTVTHPDWLSAKLTEVKAMDGAIGELDLQPGIPVTVQLDGNSETLQQIEGVRADVMLYTASGGSRDATTIRHSFPVNDGSVRFTASPVEYSAFRFTLNDFFVGPELSNDPSSPNKKLNFESGEAVLIELDVLPKKKARGRIVDSSGKGIASAWVIASIENPKYEAADPDSTEADESFYSQYAKEWMSGGDAETDSSGNFEIDLAPGRVSFEVICEGHFSSPVMTEFEWSGRVEDTLPDKVLRKIPTLRGQVVDTEGKPVIGSIVRLRHRGRGDADPIGTSSADGSFELELRRIPYAWNKGDLETTVYALAFDPNSNRAGIAEIDLNDAKATTGIKVEISPKPAEWPLQAIERDPEAQKLIDLWTKQAEKTSEEFSAGQAGQLPPNMKGATWLNTNAKSLDDFRGQFVLLDFWFIGCGPCMRDMPSVKIAQQQYSKYGFSVVSVNVLGQKVEDVKSFARQHSMNYPIVVDDSQGSILEAYRPLGVVGFPSYILLGPDGKILLNDQLPSESSLREFKLEIIHEVIRDSINRQEN